MLRSDPRVSWAELVSREGESADPAAVVAPQAATSGDPILRDRPEPGKPDYVLPGYIPKQPGSNGGKLSWAEKLAATELPPGLEKRLEATTPVPWWMIALLGLALLRR